MSDNSQLGFDLGDSKKPDKIEIDPEEIRLELREILSEAKAASDGCPWDARTFQYHKTVFPQMSNWLPQEEAEQLRFEFAEEIKRIEALLAA